MLMQKNTIYLSSILQMLLPIFRIFLSCNLRTTHLTNYKFKLYAIGFTK